MITILMKFYPRNCDIISGYNENPTLLSNVKFTLSPHIWGLEDLFFTKPQLSLDLVKI